MPTLNSELKKELPHSKEWQEEAENIPANKAEQPLEMGEAEKIPTPKIGDEAKAGMEMPATTTATPAPQVYKSDELVMIEKILEEDLGDMYFGLSPFKQKEFKARGEITASKIEQLLKKTKVHVRKILNLIRAWLKIIPGVNKLFLEQEVKIKTDKIMAIKAARGE